jgi:hypothetical protein
MPSIPIGEVTAGFLTRAASLKISQDRINHSCEVSTFPPTVAAPVDGERIVPLGRMASIGARWPWLSGMFLLIRDRRTDGGTEDNGSWCVEVTVYFACGSLKPKVADTFPC